MAATLANTVAYRLSSIDQAASRTYQRLCLAFACKSAAQETAAANLATAVAAVVKKMPIMAGRVIPLGRHAAGGFNGRVEVRLTPGQVPACRPTTKKLSWSEFPETYESLAAAKMPPSRLIDRLFAPAPEVAPDKAEGDPVLLVQANFIQGGVIVCICLHHSVADAHGLAVLIEHMSDLKITSAAPTAPPTLQELKDDADQQSRLRDRLSGTRFSMPRPEEFPQFRMTIQERARSTYSVRVGTSVAQFSKTQINDAQDMVNDRNTFPTNVPARMYGVPSRPAVPDPNRVPNISEDECLLGIVWRAVVRARVVKCPEDFTDAAAFLVSTDLRRALQPALDRTYFGNASLNSYSKASITALKFPYGVDTIKESASKLKKNADSFDDKKIRCAIAIINAERDVRSLHAPNVDLNGADFVLVDWHMLPTGSKATLGMGLGAPQFMRKLTSLEAKPGCVVLPYDGAVWEVQFALPSEALWRLKEEDEGTKLFMVG